MGSYSSLRREQRKSDCLCHCFKEEVQADYRKETSARELYVIELLRVARKCC